MARYWTNTETGEVFLTREDAERDAAENYDYGDPTNAARLCDLPYEVRDTEQVEEGIRVLSAILSVFGKNAA